MKTKFRITAKDSSKIVIDVSIETAKGELLPGERLKLKNTLRNKIFDVLRSDLPFTPFDVDQIRLR